MRTSTPMLLFGFYEQLALRFIVLMVYLFSGGSLQSVNDTVDEDCMGTSHPLISLPIVSPFCQADNIVYQPVHTDYPLQTLQTILTDTLPQRYFPKGDAVYEDEEDPSEIMLVRLPVESCVKCNRFSIEAGYQGAVYLSEVNMTIYNNTKPGITQCIFLLTVPPEHYIELKMTNFDLYSSYKPIFKVFDIVNGKVHDAVYSHHYSTLSVIWSACNKVYVVTGAARAWPDLDTPWLSFTYEAKPQASRNHLPVVFSSDDRGFITSPGFDGRTAYSGPLDLSADLVLPQDSSVVMISFPYFDLADVYNLCRVVPYITVDDSVSVYKKYEHNYTILFHRCGFEPVPPYVINASLHVVFKADNVKGRLGFKILFSFHPLPLIPQLLPNGMFNCSVSYYTSFKQHLECNLEVECQDGEDERDCPFNHPACNGSLGYQNMCFGYFAWHEKLSWNQADKECRGHGGNLVSLSSLRKLQVFQKMFKFGRRRAPVFIGGSTVYDFTLPLFYKDIWQWQDRIMAYYINISYIFLQGRPFKNQVCLLYHAVYSSVVFFAVPCDKPNYQHFVCEFESDRPLSEKANHTQDINITVVSRAPDSHLFLCPEGHVAHDFLLCDPACRCGVEVYSTMCIVPGHGVMPKFECSNSWETLPFTLVCNFHQDCSDGSDEDFCHHSACLEHTCANGQCINPGQWCDNVTHCVDESDERDCTWVRFGYSVLENRRISPPAVVHFTERSDYEVKPLPKDKACPDTHFLCPSSYCLPVYVRCNGVYDCPDREDELRCQQYACPGYYRCRASSVCVHLDHLCDGVPHCPQQDDEWVCSHNLTCPEGCLCQGLAFVCNRAFLAEAHPGLRYLDASGSGLTTQDLTKNTYLVFLSLSHNNMSALHDMSFPNLLGLDLSENDFRMINVNNFVSLKNLRVLYLAGNPLVSVLRTESDATQGQLLVLDLSHTLLEVLHSEVFSIFTSLQKLNLSGSSISTIDSSGFGFLPGLTHLDMRGVSLRVFPVQLFLGVAHIQSVMVENWRVCCPTALPAYYDVRRCSAPADPLSSCEHLLSSNFHRTWLGMVSLASLAGNLVCVIVIKLFLQDGLTSSNHSLLVANLNAVSLVMGAALTVPITADLIFRPHYLQHEASWKTSAGCKSVRFLSVVSSVVSTLTILGLTVERGVIVCWSKIRLRLLESEPDSNPAKQRVIAVSIMTTWMLGIAFGAIHLHTVNVLSDSYEQPGLCLPVLLSGTNIGLTISVLNFAHLVLNLFICMGQAVIYWSARGHILITSSTQNTRDKLLARRMMPVIISHTVCWLFIGLLNLLVVSGINVPDEVTVGAAIFVLPAGSALSPCLYLFHVWLEKRRLGQEKKMLQWLEARACCVKIRDPEPRPSSDCVPLRDHDPSRENGPLSGCDLSVDYDSVQDHDQSRDCDTSCDCDAVQDCDSLHHRDHVRDHEPSRDRDISRDLGSPPISRTGNDKKTFGSVQEAVHVLREGINNNELTINDIRLRLRHKDHEYACKSPAFTSR